ncbi:PHP domain-containing protein [Haloferax sp. YSMS24]|uniref:PHP domain-containing protein n=1 Tax=Haloferax sp. YSMS24 TaxID=3388425 RepID=UPI00398CAE93
MFDCDLHTHSRFFHFEPEVAAAYDPIGTRLTLGVARRRGLDGIAVTNHDYFETETLVSPNCLPGIEISTTQGHLLVVGPSPPKRTRRGELTPAEAVDLAHEHDCAAIIAHPFRNSTLRESDASFDAIEVNGKHPEHRRRIETIANDRGIPVVGGSDAHFPFEVGRISTRLDIDSFTPEAVVDAIRAGRVEPHFRDGPLLRGLGAVYSKIHQLKGHSNQSHRVDGR